MSNIVLVILCIAGGILIRKIALFPENAPSVLNKFVLYISLPALTLFYVHRVTLNSDLIYVVSMPWVLFALSLAFVYPIARLLNMDRGTTGAILLCAATSNTSFIGFPMIEAFYGKQDVGTGVIIDQLGNYLVVSILGLTLAAAFSGRAMSVRTVIKSLAFFPASWAMIIAFATLWLPYPAWADEILRRLGDTLVPLAVVAIGLQLQWGHLSGNLRGFALGLSFKLVVGPLIILLLYATLFHLRGRVFQVGVFEIAMSPSIMAAIIAIENRLNPPLVTALVGLGIPLSFLTLPAWWYILQRF